jgi:hypothetical protein
MNFFRFLLSLCTCTGRVVLLVVMMSSPLGAHDSGPAIARAAQAWLDSLTPEQAQEAVFNFENAERKNWNFVPRAERGLSVAKMSAEQRTLAKALLAASLSHRGLQKAEGVIALEGILREAEGEWRDPERYYVSIFGRPGGDQPWAWRWQGHHLSLNFTQVGTGAVALTPSFFGANPAKVRSGPQSGRRVLAEEEDRARALFKSLSPDQQRTALLETRAPREIFNVPGRIKTQPQGLARGQMSAAQQGAFDALIKEYLYRCRTDAADAAWQRLESAGLDAVHFAWAGSVEPGEPHYYRVQGPTFVLEYDNTQNGANHVHSLWRDTTTDFGGDPLGDHVHTSHP